MDVTELVGSTEESGLRRYRHVVRRTVAMSQAKRVIVVIETARHQAQPTTIVYTSTTAVIVP